MKNWITPEINEISIKATALTPTTEMSADDYADGYFKQGTNIGSGPKQEIPYYPNSGK